MAHHEPLKALGPIDWSEVAGDDLKHFMTSTFAQAQTVIDSLPTPLTLAKLSQTGRARSHTDSSVFASPARASRDQEHANTTANEDEAAAVAATHAAQLQKEWKEVKMSPKDNPMNISVYKMPGKDGRGAWFARRSVHEGIPFDKFKLGLEREFGETMKNSTGTPGTGNVRGIGAEQKAEHLVCDGVGEVDVWLLSAQFPGPTTPRDFVALLMTGSGQGKKQGKGGPRQYTVVSKPCNHPECAPRSGYIRGTYESVEIIREVPVEKPLRQTRSSVDLRREEIQLPSPQPAGDKLGREALLRSASQRGTRKSEQSLAFSMSELPPRPTVHSPSADLEGTKTEMAVEWLMVTRSDPGGSVPRFMVEKGTPNGIVNDASRFVQWLASKSAEDFEDSGDTNIKEDAVKSEQAPALPPRQRHPASNVALSQQLSSGPPPDQYPPSGLYSMVTGVLGAASSVVTSRLPTFVYTSGPETELDTTVDDSESDESERSYASALEPEPSPPLDERTKSRADLTSLLSGKSDDSGSKASTTQHEKQLKKLQDRYRKLEDKMAKQQERNMQGKKDQGGDTLAKLREKHEKEIARQEENYKKEVRKLEEKRLKEEKKAEDRRKKGLEKEAKNKLAMELERTQVERDMALKQADILKEQVGELQAQNTQLVAKLGKLGALGQADESLGGENGKADVRRMSQISPSRSK